MTAKYSDIIDKTAVIILAAGKGTRMGSADRAKVCFEIDGQPAINSTVNAFKSKGFKNINLVVGFMAEQVMQALSSEHPDVKYIYQNPQLGTGHAAKIAADCLSAQNHNGYVLITMGDKYMEPEVLDYVVEGFIKKNADFALLTLPKNKQTELSGGRVLTNEKGIALAIIEKMDIARLGISDDLKLKLAKEHSISVKSVSTILNKHIQNINKQKTAVPEIHNLLNKNGKLSKEEVLNILELDKYNFQISGRQYSAKEIEKVCKTVNPSLYLLNTDSFYYAVRQLKNDNAQNEYYLTDIVYHLNQRKNSDGQQTYKIAAVNISDYKMLQGFNSPEELLAIGDYVNRKKKKKTQTEPAYPINLDNSQYNTVKNWLAKLDKMPLSFKNWMKKIYGNNPDLHSQKRKDFISVLKCYGSKFGFEQKVVIVRSPGRVNLMGRHVDHRGGYNNFLAIHKETIAVAGIREDDQIIAHNVNSKLFKPVKFSIDEQIGRFAWSDWLNFINSQWVQNLLHSSRGDWSNYIKAAVLRLQHQYQGLKIKGVNMAVLGDVPIAAGLSSSSTLVVTSLQAAIALNGLELTTQQFIDLCGEGEWFVGSRGGAGDHAAIYIGQRGRIVNVGFLPFKVEQMVTAPQDYQVLIVNSHLKAAKSAGAKSIFNSKVCSYNVGLEILKMRCPEIAGRVQYLRDVNPDVLGCKTSDIYKYLKKVPQFITRKEMEQFLPASFHNKLKEYFQTHSDLGRYELRGVLVFGISEIIRSKLSVELLGNGKIEEFGKFMNISHNGDRVSRADDKGVYSGIQDWHSDDYLDKLCIDLNSEDPQKVLEAQLYMQSGWYGCSTAEIDQIVDIANKVEGVAGAQIAGAGLGGCVIILARKNSIENVSRELVKHYYKPRKLKPEIIPCTTVDGSGLAEF